MSTLEKMHCHDSVSKISYYTKFSDIADIVAYNKSIARTAGIRGAKEHAGMGEQII